MSKRLSVITWLMVFAMMISICSCSGTATVTETETETEIEETQPLDRLSEKTPENYKEFYAVLIGLIGKDEASAEKELGELFGGELTQTSEHKIGDLNTIHTYKVSITICEIEFSEIEVLIKEETGLVFKINVTYYPETPNAGSEVYKAFKESFEDIYGLKAEMNGGTWDGISDQVAGYYPTDNVYLHVQLKTFGPNYAKKDFVEISVARNDDW